MGCVALRDMLRYTASVREWMAADPLNIIAIHCKGGKGDAAVYTKIIQVMWSRNIYLCKAVRVHHKSVLKEEQTHLGIFLMSQCAASFKKREEEARQWHFWSSSKWWEDPSPKNHHSGVALLFSHSHPLAQPYQMPHIQHVLNMNNLSKTICFHT